MISSTNLKVKNYIIFLHTYFALETNNRKEKLQQKNLNNLYYRGKKILNNSAMY